MADPVSESTAKELLHRVQGFREKWAKFALHSRRLLSADWFESFTRDGVPLPKEFLDTYQELVREKRELARFIRSRTATNCPEGWKAPGEDEPLRDFEAALERLIVLCREAERRSREERDFLLTLTGVVVGLRNENPQPENEFEKVHREAIRLRDELSQHRAPLSDRHRAVVPAYLALVRLIGDAILQRPSGTSGAASTGDARLPYAELQECFRIVSEQLGTTVSFDAMRGCLRPKEDQVDALRSVSAGQAPTGPLNARVTREQIAKLERTLGGGKSGTSSQQMTATPHAAESRPEPPISLQELASVAERLREMASRLLPDSRYQSSLSDGNPDHIRATGYWNLAMAIDLAGEILTAPGADQNEYRNELHDLLRLIAEAQNAVRAEHEGRQPGTPPLPEQEYAFRWLRHIAGANTGRFRIERFMKLDDRADPTNNADVADRLNQFAGRWKKLLKRVKLFDRVARAAEQITSAKGHSGPASATPDQWKSIDKAVCELLELGVPPSDTHLREMLLLIADELPDEPADDGEPEFEPSESLLQVFDQLQQFLNVRRKPGESESEPDADDTPDVVDARGLLSGREVVIVGGVPKPHAASRIERKLHLSRVRWIPARKQDRVERFAPEIRRAAVVVLVTKVIGHKHNEIREICRNWNIPCVQLPRTSGYSPNTIAREIMQQVSDQL